MPFSYSPNIENRAKDLQDANYQSKDILNILKAEFPNQQLPDDRTLRRWKKQPRNATTTSQLIGSTDPAIGQGMADLWAKFDIKIEDCSAWLDGLEHDLQELIRFHKYLVSDAVKDLSDLNDFYNSKGLPVPPKDKNAISQIIHRHLTELKSLFRNGREKDLDLEDSIKTLLAYNYVPVKIPDNQDNQENQTQSQADSSSDKASTKALITAYRKLLESTGKKIRDKQAIINGKPATIIMIFSDANFTKIEQAVGIDTDGNQYQLNPDNCMATEIKIA
jgi:hypothetical protein